MSFVMALLTLLGIASAVVVRLATDWASAGLGELYRGHAADSAGPGGHGRIRLQFRDPGLAARIQLLPRRDYSFFIGSRLDAARAEAVACAAARSRNWRAKSFSRRGDSAMSYVYVGTELELFAAAKQLEVLPPPAGRPLRGPRRAGGWRRQREHHPRALRRLRPIAGSASSPTRLWPTSLIASIGDGELPDCCRIQVGTLGELGELESVRHDSLHGRPRAHRRRPGRAGPGRPSPAARRAPGGAVAGAPVALHPV